MERRQGSSLRLGYVNGDEVSMEVKKHLSGGTLKVAMVEAVKAAVYKFAGEGQALEKAAIELGITPRTLNIWLGPVDKGGWAELEGVKQAIGTRGVVEHMLDVAPKLAKRRSAKRE